MKIGIPPPPCPPDFVSPVPGDSREPRAESSLDATLNTRHKSYGVYADASRIAQDLKYSMRLAGGWGSLRADQREALEMIATKIGRILNGNRDHIDSWHDIAGYAKLIEHRLNGKSL